MNKQEQIKFIEDNYPSYTNHHSNRRLRHDFFKNIQTELQAYLLGFYAADGNINEKRKTFRIHLQQKDSELVYLYKDVISPDARIFTVKPHEVTARNGMKVQGHESFGVDICSTILCNDLVNLGYGYNKSYSELHLPTLDKELIKHFIRGFADGDGSFSWYVPNEKNKKPRVKGSWSICSKTRTLFDDINKYLKEYYHFELNICFARRDQMYILGTSSRETIKKIYDIFYKDSNFYLSRKFNKISHYVNTEVTQLIDEYRNAQKVNVSESNNPSTSTELPTDNSGKMMCAEQ